MRLWLFVPALALTGAQLSAQAPVPAATASCGNGAPLLVRSLVGGALGGWLGFVGAKIRQSDWSDASRTASAHRARVQATIGGAAIGAVIGSLVHVGHSCGAPARDQRIGQQAITLDEIARSGQSGSVYDLVFALRRNWLNVREATPEYGDASERYVVVYMDNTRLGSTEELKRIPANTVTLVRYFDAAQATYRWGGRNPSGAIEVVSSTGR